jgi:hypothetical protein
MGKEFDVNADVQEVNDVRFFGGINEEIATHPIRLSYSRKGAKATRAGEWQVWEGTVGEFVGNSSKFEVGSKDGMCILQGEAIDGHRTARAMKQLDILLMDHDTGITFADVCQLAEESGIWTFVWTTHSHGKATTSIKLAEFTRRKKGTEDYHVSSRSEVTEDLVYRYLTEKKGYLPAVLEGMKIVEIAHTAQGEEVIVKHQPMDKCRSMRILKDPFVLQDRKGGVEGAMQEWKQVITAAAKYLKSPQYDASCTDTSRLMYTPRIPAGAEIGYPNHRMAVINGDFLDLNDLPIMADVLSIGEKFKKAGGVADAKHFETPNLLKFVSKHALMFDAALWLEEIAPEDVVDHRGAGGIHFLCPNWESHSTHTDGETSFMVTNGSEEGNGFNILCRHQGCEEASGKDRVWYLDQLCQKYGVTDAMDLVDWVEGYDPEEEDEEETKEEHEVLLESLKTEIDEALEEDDPERLATLAGVLAKKYKEIAGKREITQLIKLRAKKEQKHIDPNDYDGPILSNMDPDVQFKVLLKHVNRICRADHDPRVFQREEGGAIRLKEMRKSGQFSMKEMNSDQWNLFLHENVQFLNAGKDGEPPKKAMPFPPLVNLISAEPDSLQLEVLDRVVGVPVFSADGTLRMHEGYDRATKCYVMPSPGFEMKTVKKNPTESDVSYALYLLLEELLIGFPFTDDFRSADPLPIWEDQENFQLNFKRGRCARINALAMLLQPFARNLINGPCPAYIIDKPENGMGATTLAELVGILIDGSKTEPRSGNSNNEEMRKSLTTALRGGANVVFLDNVNEHIDSGDLAAVLTSGTWTDRILGKSEEVRIDIRAEFIFTGNQMTMSQEMVRRFCPIRIQFPDTNVLGRTVKDYKHADIHDWAFEHRAELVWACHTLIQNWISKGKPYSERVIPSYGAWCRVMGGIIEAAGIHGALMGNWNDWRNSQGKDFNFAASMTSSILNEGVVQLGVPFPTRQIVDMCYDENKRAFDLIEVPPFVARSNDVGRATQSLGSWLSKDFKGRIIPHSPDPDNPDKKINVTWRDNGMVNGKATWVIEEFVSG